jgi:uncharacterized RDD family membrane protein YckC
MTADELSLVPREARPFQGTTAGLMTRLIASGIDAVTVVALLVATFLGVNGVRFVINPVSFQVSDTSLISSVMTALVVLVAYLTAAWSVTGRTYGDHVMGLRVVGRTGGRVRLLTAFVRAVLSVVFPLGLLWCAVSTSRRSVQDVVLRTVVIYDWLPRPDLSSGASSTRRAPRR